MPNILIIEDNQKIAEAISKFLKRKELDSHIVSDGINAVRAFVGAPYDLLLIDIELPVMNGDAVCRAIRDSAKGRSVPIVMMSMAEHDPAEIARLTRELSLSGFLLKPFSSDTLFEVISSALQLSPPEPAAPPTPPQATLPQPMQAALDTTPFEKVLFYLMKKKGTGVLTVAREPLQRKFFFIGGALTDLELSAADAGFGAFLARRDLIDGEELKAYEDRKKTGAPDPEGLLIKMGCLTPRAYQEEYTQFMQDRLVECFSWRSGTVLFEWGAPGVPTAPVAAAYMPALFYRGFLAHLDQAAMSSFVAQKGKLYASRTAEFFELQNHLAAEMASPELLDLVDGTRTCTGIAGAIDTDDAAVVLYTLDYLKMLSYSAAPVATAAQPTFPIRKREPRRAEAPAELFEDLGGALSDLAEEVGALGEMTGALAAAGGGATALEEELNRQWEAIKGKNFYEMFGMTPKTFSFENLKKSYFELTRTYGPEKFFGSSGQVMELAEELLSKASHAYETLSNVVSKENYDEILSRQEQVPTEGEDKEFYEKVQFQSGKVLLEQGQCESAEKAFTNCLNIDQDKAEYHAYLALAIYNNPANKGNPAAIKWAKDAVNRSLQLGKLAISYALKGTMYLDEGGVNFAEAEFKKALKLNPNNKTAIKHLDAIRQSREEEKKGFFQKLFT